MSSGSDEKTASLLQIGDVAEQVDLSLRTVRYYEEVGLIRPSARSDGGFRLYSEDDVQRLRVVKRMRSFRFTLEEMGRLADILEESARPNDLDEPGLEEVVEGLREYAARTDRAIERAERELAEARQLRIRIAEHLVRCEALLEQSKSR